MLVEIEGERVRVFAGLAMRWRLVQVLGPVRALRVAQAVARMGGPVLGVDWGRRRLLRQSLALAGLALLRRIPGGTHAPRTAGSAPPRLGPGEGELWEGFVLLPEGAPLPSFVTCAPAPILCQSADPEKDLWGETLEAPDEGPLRAAPGLPVPMLEGWPLRQTTVIRFQQDGRLFAALLIWRGGDYSAPMGLPGLSAAFSGVARLFTGPPRDADPTGESVLHAAAGGAPSYPNGGGSVVDSGRDSLYLKHPTWGSGSRRRPNPSATHAVALKPMWKEDSDVYLCLCVCAYWGSDHRTSELLPLQSIQL
jgi:hypothetical protein